MKVQLVGITREGPFEDRRITDNGKILRETDEEHKYIKPVNSQKGYLAVRLKGQRDLIHILVAQTFVDNPDNLPYVVHLDKDVQNNYYKNLIWSKYPDLDGDKFEIIPGFPHYRISKEGVIKTYVNEPRIIKQQIRNGYSVVTLRDQDKNSKKLQVHRLVAMTYIPNPNEFPEVDHIDQDKLNNRAGNLRWADKFQQAQNRAKPIAKPILQYTINEEFIKEYDSANQAIEKLDLKVTSGALQGCAVKNKEELKCKSAGFKWRYKSYEDKYMIQEGEDLVPIKGDFGDIVLDYPKCKITSFGNVINERGIAMKKGHKEYPCVGLNKNGSQKTFQVHILVALFFVKGRTATKCIVDHLDEDKNNSHYTNLEWVTRSENALVRDVKK